MYLNKCSLSNKIYYSLFLTFLKPWPELKTKASMIYHFLFSHIYSFKMLSFLLLFSAKHFHCEFWNSSSMANLHYRLILIISLPLTFHSNFRLEHFLICMHHAFLWYASDKIIERDELYKEQSEREIIFFLLCLPNSLSKLTSFSFKFCLSILWFSSGTK